MLKLIADSRSVAVRRQCVSLLPQLIKYLPMFQNSEQQFHLAMVQIFKFMKKKERDKQQALLTKGCGYVALGKISLLAKRSQFERHLPDLLN